MASSLSSDHYPETLGVYLIVNAPGFFPFVWRMIKGFIDEKTRASIKVLNKSDQFQTLTEIIDIENLPSFLGGKCTCEDAGGDCMRSDKGPWRKYVRVPPRWVKRRESLDRTSI